MTGQAFYDACELNKPKTVDKLHGAIEESRQTIGSYLLEAEEVINKLLRARARLIYACAHGKGKRGEHMIQSAIDALRIEADKIGVCVDDTEAEFCHRQKLMLLALG